ncbi:hypothetical protein TNCV_677821 [Trichonephila clavipes]|nr:hypothetical protein TNCV_677821 [Trichonephila clavipes]
MCVLGLSKGDHPKMSWRFIGRRIIPDIKRIYVGRSNVYVYSSSVALNSFECIRGFVQEIYQTNELRNRLQNSSLKRKRNRVVAVQRTCTLQWLPAHADIFGNEQADSLAKEVRNFPHLSNNHTLSDDDAIV